jgi:hypothetical protein
MRNCCDVQGISQRAAYLAGSPCLHGAYKGHATEEALQFLGVVT